MVGANDNNSDGFDIWLSPISVPESFLDTIRIEWDAYIVLCAALLFIMLLITAFVFARNLTRLRSPGSPSAHNVRILGLSILSIILNLVYLVDPFGFSNNFSPLIRSLLLSVSSMLTLAISGLLALWLIGLLASWRRNSRRVVISRLAAFLVFLFSVSYVTLEALGSDGILVDLIAVNVMRAILFVFVVLFLLLSSYSVISSGFILIRQNQLVFGTPSFRNSINSSFPRSNSTLVQNQPRNDAPKPDYNLLPSLSRRIAIHYGWYPRLSSRTISYARLYHRSSRKCYRIPHFLSILKEDLGKPSDKGKGDDCHPLKPSSQVEDAIGMVRSPLAVLSETSVSFELTSETQSHPHPISSSSPELLDYVGLNFDQSTAADNNLKSDANLATHGTPFLFDNILQFSQVHPSSSQQFPLDTSRNDLVKMGNNTGTTASTTRSNECSPFSRYKNGYLYVEGSSLREAAIIESIRTISTGFHMNNLEKPESSASSYLPHSMRKYFIRRTSKKRMENTPNLSLSSPCTPVEREETREQPRIPRALAIARAKLLLRLFLAVALMISVLLTWLVLFVTFMIKHYLTPSEWLSFISSSASVRIAVYASSLLALWVPPTPINPYSARTSSTTHSPGATGAGAATSLPVPGRAVSWGHWLLWRLGVVTFVGRSGRHAGALSPVDIALLADDVSLAADVNGSGGASGGGPLGLVKKQKLVDVWDDPKVTRAMRAARRRDRLLNVMRLSEPSSPAPDANSLSANHLTGSEETQSIPAPHCPQSSDSKDSTSGGDDIQGAASGGDSTALPANSSSQRPLRGRRGASQGASTLEGASSLALLLSSPEMGALIVQSQARELQRISLVHDAEKAAVRVASRISARERVLQGNSYAPSPTGASKSAPIRTAVVEVQVDSNLPVGRVGLPSVFSSSGHSGTDAEIRRVLQEDGIQLSDEEDAVERADGKESKDGVVSVDALPADFITWLVHDWPKSGDGKPQLAPLGMKSAPLRSLGPAGERSLRAIPRVDLDRISMFDPFSDDTFKANPLFLPPPPASTPSAATTGPRQLVSPTPSSKFNSKSDSVTMNPLRTTFPDDGLAREFTVNFLSWAGAQDSARKREEGAQVAVGGAPAPVLQLPVNESKSLLKKNPRWRFLGSHAADTPAVSDETLEPVLLPRDVHQIRLNTLNSVPILSTEVSAGLGATFESQSALASAYVEVAAQELGLAAPRTPNPFRVLAAVVHSNRAPFDSAKTIELTPIESTRNACRNPLREGLEERDRLVHIGGLPTARARPAAPLSTGDRRLLSRQAIAAAIQAKGLRVPSNLEDVVPDPKVFETVAHGVQALQGAKKRARAAENTQHSHTNRAVYYRFTHPISTRTEVAPAALSSPPVRSSVHAGWGARDRLGSAEYSASASASASFSDSFSQTYDDENEAEFDEFNGSELYDGSRRGGLQDDLDSEGPSSLRSRLHSQEAPSMHDEGAGVLLNGDGPKVLDKNSARRSDIYRDPHPQLSQISQISPLGPSKVSFPSIGVPVTVGLGNRISVRTLPSRRLLEGPKSRRRHALSTSASWKGQGNSNSAPRESNDLDPNNLARSSSSREGAEGLGFSGSRDSCRPGAAPSDQFDEVGESESANSEDEVPDAPDNFTPRIDSAAPSRSNSRSRMNGGAPAELNSHSQSQRQLVPLLSHGYQAAAVDLRALGLDPEGFEGLLAPDGTSNGLGGPDEVFGGIRLPKEYLDSLDISTLSRALFLQSQVEHSSAQMRAENQSGLNSSVLEEGASRSRLRASVFDDNIYDLSGYYYDDSNFYNSDNSSDNGRKSDEYSLPSDISYDSDTGSVVQGKKGVNEFLKKNFAWANEFNKYSHKGNNFRSQRSKSFN